MSCYDDRGVSERELKVLFGGWGLLLEGDEVEKLMESLVLEI